MMGTFTAVSYTHLGAMKFIGHLDIMRYFQKAVKRAGLDAAFSEGYSPHMIMSFASPLGVGITSTGEYFDLELKSASSSEEMVKRLNDADVYKRQGMYCSERSCPPRRLFFS